MKVITWNCNMAFRKKWPHLLTFDPDIMVIQECEVKSKYALGQQIPGLNDFIWIGDNENKGIGILSFKNIRLSLASEHVDKFRYIVPVDVTGYISVRLWAIWAMPEKGSKRNSYVGQIWNAVNHYKSFLKSKQTILIGDFNSNAIWDQERYPENHSMLVKLLAERNIHSLYHEQTGEAHGLESIPTFFLVKKKEKPYHLDYCFASSDLIKPETTIEVGHFADWIKLSDHVPLIIGNLGS